jgi:hypothetical protein
MASLSSFKLILFCLFINCRVLFFSSTFVDNKDKVFVEKELNLLLIKINSLSLS